MVLSIRARNSRSGQNRPGLPMLFGLIGLVINISLIIVMVVGVLLSNARPTQVEVHAQGGPKFIVEFSDDNNNHTQEWQSKGWKLFTTTKSTAKIKVTAAQDDKSSTVSCQIYWNGNLVASEASSSGTVTCQYEK